MKKFLIPGAILTAVGALTALALFASRGRHPNW